MKQIVRIVGLMLRLDWYFFFPFSLNQWTYNNINTWIMINITFIYNNNISNGNNNKQTEMRNNGKRERERQKEKQIKRWLLLAHQNMHISSRIWNIWYFNRKQKHNFIFELYWPIELLTKFKKIKLNYSWKRWYKLNSAFKVEYV